MSRRKSILLAILLSLPIILFLLHHYFYHSSNLKPTGITNSENVLYISYAHQYLDQENFSLFYSNPFDGNPSSPEIYFQPANFLIVAAMKLGISPGLAFSLFGLLMAMLCIYLGIRIINHLLPDNKNKSLIALLFTWGGGLTALTGIFISFLGSGHQAQSWIDGIYMADPAKGWWGLNWGRILFIPLEAYYHFLFLLCILLILKNKWIGAAIIGLLLSASHPFTGLAYLFILWEWIAIEKSFFKNKNIPWWFIIVSALTLTLDVYYYLSYLPSFPEHNQIFNQYSVAWTYSFRIFIPAYAIVALITYISIRTKKKLGKILEFPYQRLFLTWAIVAFLLSKHEWFIKPMQPIHFTRGYVWAGLFLFALPTLAKIIDGSGKNKLRKWLITGFILILLSDNILWTSNILRKKETVEGAGHITKETEDVLSFLKTTSSPKDLLTGNASLINYLVNVYAAANSWVSHPYNTPTIEERIAVMNNFLTTGIQPSEWKERRILIVINKKSEPLMILPSLQSNKLFENSTYIIFTP